MPYNPADEGVASDLSPDLEPIAADLERPYPDGPVGLGGWLILVGLGVVLTPLVVLVSSIATFAPLFQNGTWEALTTPGSPDYAPLFAPLVAFEMLANLLLFGLSVVVAVQFFRTSRHFPTLYVTMLLSSLCVVTLDALLVGWVFPGVEVFTPDTITSIIQELSGAAIWIPYVLVSERVANTFVR